MGLVDGMAWENEFGYIQPVTTASNSSNSSNSSTESTPSKSEMQIDRLRSVIDDLKIFPEYDIEAQGAFVIVSSHAECITCQFDDIEDFTNGIQFALDVIRNHWSKHKFK